MTSTNKKRNMSSQLISLTQTLKKDIQDQKEYIQTIPYPKLLVKALEEIQEVIGNDSVKESIFTQLTHILGKKKRNKHLPPNSNSDDPTMLNVLFYGPPGTGKTLIATKLAKVWWSLGYIKSKKKEKNNERSFQNPFSYTEGLSSSHGDMDEMSLLFIINTIVILGSIVFSIAQWVYSRTGFIGVLVILAIFCSLFLIIMDLYLESLEEEEPLTNAQNNNYVENKENIDFPDSLIKIVSRDDFVDRYAGWSDKKTLKLLQRNLGKVLFIDEAYSLCNGSRDMFGMEVLNTLNLFMSQHPGEIIIIFAGYKDLIEQRLFRAQPGLKRRFMWYFDCKGYNPSELFKIYQMQLQNKNLNIQDKSRIMRLFIKYYHLFENFGGDTERLAFFSEIEHGKDIVMEDQDQQEFQNTSNLDIINIVQFKRALKKLKHNRVSTSSKDTSETMIEDWISKCGL